MDCLKIINQLNEELDGLQKVNRKLNITLEYINNECEETNKYEDMCGAWINFSDSDALWELYQNEKKEISVEEAQTMRFTRRSLIIY